MSLFNCSRMLSSSVGMVKSPKCYRKTVALHCFATGCCLTFPCVRGVSCYTPRSSLSHLELCFQPFLSLCVASQTVSERVSHFTGGCGSYIVACRAVAGHLVEWANHWTPSKVKVQIVTKCPRIVRALSASAWLNLESFQQTFSLRLQRNLIKDQILANAGRWATKMDAYCSKNDQLILQRPGPIVFCWNQFISDWFQCFVLLQRRKCTETKAGKSRIRSRQAYLPLNQ